MTREIKFRWLDEDGDLIYREFEDMCYHDLSFDMGKNYRSSPVMQYTGLKDKNGVEIYEGDIVRSDLIPDTSEVTFFNGAFWIYLAPLGSFLDLDKNNLPKGYNIEVIGNIYKNMEVLNRNE